MQQNLILSVARVGRIACGAAERKNRALHRRKVKKKRKNNRKTKIEKEQYAPCESEKESLVYCSFALFTLLLPTEHHP